MPTVQTIIERAGRKIGANDMTTAELADALSTFNEMVSGWRLHGIDIWRSELGADDQLDVTAIVPEAVLDDEFPMPDAFREGAIYMLASRMAPEFSMAFDADEYLRRMQMHYMRVTTVEADPILRYDNRNWYATWL